MNILIFTLGTSWLIVPEVLGFLDPDKVRVYENRTKPISAPGLPFPDEVWLIATKHDPSAKVAPAVDLCAEWMRRVVSDVVVRSVEAESIEDLTDDGMCRGMRDLIFRTVLRATEAADGGSVVLSLAGGRKTMSADLQDAGSLFGCEAMVHVLASGKPPVWQARDFVEFSEDEAASIVPVVTSRKRAPASFLFGGDAPTSARYPVWFQGESGRNLLSTGLVDRIEDLRARAGTLLVNYSGWLQAHSRNGFFPAFHTLHPQVVQRLQSERIGFSPESEEADLQWIHRLPKTDLHCHFGGVLSPQETVRVALTMRGSVQESVRRNSGFAEWVHRVRGFVESEDVVSLRDLYSDRNRIRTPVPGVPEPLGVCAFLSCFENREDLLEHLMYGPVSSMVGIGIGRYEHLGDLQGSALTQSEACVREICRCITEHDRESNVQYCEVRCSPLNCRPECLAPEDFVRILLEEWPIDPRHHVNLLFVASRHGDPERVRETVAFAERMLTGPCPNGWTEELLAEFRERFVGFDLAGAEGAGKASQFRGLFDPLLRRCVKMTIHAGETESVESIWDAVYGLGADRIGHGLRLADRPELIDKFLDRRIGIELCPSSNYQIVGFRDDSVPESRSLDRYPLRQYLDLGLRVSVNTDDPGISRTRLDREYIKAARMTDGGLSKWDVLRLVYNGFSMSFAPYAKRRQILDGAEREILKRIGQEYSGMPFSILPDGDG